MIQRKQTLFLLFSILISVGYLFSPVVTIEGGGTSRNILASGINMNIGFPIIGHYFVYLCLIAACISIGINLLTILLYHNRPLQMFLCWLSIFPLIFAFCFAYYKWSTTEMIDDQIFNYGNISPWVAIVFILAAWFSIKQDEELVKSADRLR